MDDDRERAQEADRVDRDSALEGGNTGYAGEVDVGPAGIAAGNLTAANMGSSLGGGLGGGLLGAFAADEALDDNPVQDDHLADRLPDESSNMGLETGDEGVSPAQKELEAGELNG